MQKGRILIVDDNQDVLLALNLLLEPIMEQVRVTARPEHIVRFVEEFDPDVILLDMNYQKDAMSGQEGFYWLEQIRQVDPDAVVVCMTAYADLETAVQAIRAGAVDFVSKPWEKEKLLATLSTAVELRRNRCEVKNLKRQLSAVGMPQGSGVLVIGESPAMQQVFELVDKIRDTMANVLITGENGTGKDLIARLIHERSSRSGKVFVSVDLGAIPESLFESELFGYEKGAFTDARRDKPGRLEAARGGTLFLDEVGNMSLAMQAKLLSAIEKQQITKLGAIRPMSIDVRLISATNACLHEMACKGQFRQDLLYRLNTIEIDIPPLRDRGSDVLLLAKHFLHRFARKYGRELGDRLPHEVIAKLKSYHWPGNVRELEHAIERAVLLSQGNELKPEHFILSSVQRTKWRVTEEFDLNKIEKDAIERALNHTERNTSRAALLLGITRYALYRKIQKHNI